jgi:hypothetical protein
MTLYNSIKLLEAFRDFCLSKGKSVIVHIEPGKGANWNVCAVGQFGEFKKVKVGNWGRGHTMAEKLSDAFDCFNNRQTYQDLCKADRAEELFPTFDKLAVRLTADIEAFQAQWMKAKK